MTQDWSEPGLAALAGLVERQTGLTWSASRRDSAELGMRRAMERARVASLRDYVRLVRDDAVARDELIAELTVGETYFFRDPAQFALLREEILPAFRERPADRPIRVWSAGCASGEEAYSLAIVLIEQGLGDHAAVVGTDIARHRLAAARQAHYTRWSLRGVPPSTVMRYFRPAGGRHVLDERVRGAVDFRYLNLAEDQYPSLASGIWGMDIVFCRNVLIYFDRETVARVAHRLIASLAADGWLLLGAADPPIAELVDCEVHVSDAGISYRRPSPRPAPQRWRPPQQDTRAAPQPPSVPAADEAAAAAGAPARTREPAPPVPPAQAPSSELRPPLVSRPADEARAAGATPSDPTAALEAARAAYAARDYAYAADLAAAAAPDEPEAWILRVRALANLGRLVDAGRVCLAGLERHATAPELVYLHSVLLAHAERPIEARAAAKQALYLDRTLIVGHIALADAAGRLGDDATLRRSLRNAEHLLERVPPTSTVPASDGELAGRMLQLVRTRLGILEAV